MKTLSPLSKKYYDYAKEEDDESNKFQKGVNAGAFQRNRMCNPLII